MNKLLIILTATVACAGAFGQGKLSFDINSDNLIYFTTAAAFLAPGDALKTADNGFGEGPFPIAGSSAYNGLGLNDTPGTIASLTGSPTLIAGLYGGISPSSLSLVTTTTIADVNNPGGVVAVNMILNGFPAGVPAWFQIQVFDSRANASAPVYCGVGGGAADAWDHHLGAYAGFSQTFQATPQSAYYAPIWQRTPPVNSTWAAGTFVPVDLVQLGGGYYGGIVVNSRLSPPPFICIYSQPRSTTNYWGQSATFSVGAAGYPVTGYQWKANGTNLSDGPHVSGSRTNQLTLSGITLADAGSYQLFLTDYMGDTATSEVATLTVVLVRPSIARVVPQADGTVALNLTGTPNSSNRLWATASLTPPVVWSPVSTNFASPAGTWQVTDTNAAGWPTRFYRASMP